MPTDRESGHEATEERPPLLARTPDGERISPAAAIVATRTGNIGTSSHPTLSLAPEGRQGRRHPNTPPCSHLTDSAG